MGQRHCNSCSCSSVGLFTTTFDHNAGRLASAQTTIPFSGVIRAERMGVALAVTVAGESAPLYLYNDDRDRFLAEWADYEGDADEGRPHPASEGK